MLTYIRCNSVVQSLRIQILRIKTIKANTNLIITQPLPTIILLKTPKFPERNVGIVKEVEIAKSVVKHLEKNSTKEMGLMI